MTCKHHWHDKGRYSECCECDLMKCCDVQGRLREFVNELQYKFEAGPLAGTALLKYTLERLDVVLNGAPGEPNE